MGNLGGLSGKIASKNARKRGEKSTYIHAWWQGRQSLLADEKPPCGAESGSPRVQAIGTLNAIASMAILSFLWSLIVDLVEHRTRPIRSMPRAAVLAAWRGALAMSSSTCRRCLSDSMKNLSIPMRIDEVERLAEAVLSFAPEKWGSKTITSCRLANICGDSMSILHVPIAEVRHASLENPQPRPVRRSH